MPAKLGLAVLSLVGVAACSDPDEPGTCAGESPGTGVLVVDSGATHAITCVEFRASSLGSPEYRHKVNVVFGDTLWLSFFFSSSTVPPATLELGQPLVGARQGAQLFEAPTLDGTSRALCSHPAGGQFFAAASGSLHLDDTTVGAEDRLTAIDGSIEVQLPDCTVESLGVSGQDLHLIASF